MPRELAQTSPVLELDLLSERQLADSCPYDRPRKGTEAGRWKPAFRDRAAGRAQSLGGWAERGRGVRGLAARPQAAVAVFQVGLTPFAPLVLSWPCPTPTRGRTLTFRSLRSGLPERVASICDDERLGESLQRHTPHLIQPKSRGNEELVERCLPVLSGLWRTASRSRVLRD